MDDSVIKVLRRNGSWQNSSNKAENALSNNKAASGKNLKDEDFKLDEKFQILASEIKKRMKGKNKVVSELSKSNNSIKSKAVAQELNSGSLEDINQIKLKILPYLKKLDSLIGKRQNYLKNISEIDDDLDLLYEDINSIKKDYLNTINKLKKNMNFFNDSLEIIRSAKEEK